MDFRLNRFRVGVGLALVNKQEIPPGQSNGLSHSNQVFSSLPMLDVCRKKKKLNLGMKLVVEEELRTWSVT